MKPSQLLELFRSETDDISEPFLWEDSEFYIYLNEAQEVFVRAIGGLADRRSAMTKLTYKVGDQFRKYDERIIRITDARDELNNKIKVENLDSLDEMWRGNDYGSYTSGGMDDSLTGPVKYIVNDVEATELQLYPIPDREGYIRMNVYRQPMDEITSGSSELEIPSFQHLNLLNWVKYRAFMKQDVEAFDGTKANEFKRAFNDGVDDAKKLRASRVDKKRTMAYGGIPMS